MQTNWRKLSKRAWEQQSRRLEAESHEAVEEDAGMRKMRGRRRMRGGYARTEGWHKLSTRVQSGTRYADRALPGPLAPPGATYRLLHRRSELQELLAPSMTACRGVVKFFNPVNHYGFIAGTPGIFFHEGDLRDISVGAIGNDVPVKCMYVQVGKAASTARGRRMSSVTTTASIRNAMSFSDRKYGFIELGDGGTTETVFVHTSQLQFDPVKVRAKRPEIRVEFTRVQREGKTVAVAVTRTN